MRTRKKTRTRKKKMKRMRKRKTLRQMRRMKRSRTRTTNKKRRKRGKRKMRKRKRRSGEERRGRRPYAFTRMRDTGKAVLGHWGRQQDSCPTLRSRTSCSYRREQPVGACPGGTGAWSTYPRSPPACGPGAARAAGSCRAGGCCSAAAGGGASAAGSPCSR